MPHNLRHAIAGDPPLPVNHPLQYRGAAIADPGNAGAIPNTQDGICRLGSAGAETRTLANPLYVGQHVTLVMGTDGGDIVVTVAAAFNVAGNTVITFSAIHGLADLIGVTIGANLRWQLLATPMVGAALS